MIARLQVLPTRAVAFVTAVLFVFAGLVGVQVANAPSSEAMARLCLDSYSPRSIGIDTNRTGSVAAYLQPGTCTGPSRAYYDEVYVPYGYVWTYNNINYGHGWHYVSATAGGNSRLRYA